MVLGRLPVREQVGEIHNAQPDLPQCVLCRFRHIFQPFPAADTGRVCLIIIFHPCQPVRNMIFLIQTFLPQPLIFFPFLFFTGKQFREISYSAQIRYRFSQHIIQPHRMLRIGLFPQQLHPLLCGNLRISICYIQADLRHSAPGGFILRRMFHDIRQALSQPFHLYSILPQNCIHPPDIKQFRYLSVFFRPSRIVIIQK